jgi:hypothetical protein
VSAASSRTILGLKNRMKIPLFRVDERREAIGLIGETVSHSA